MKRKLLSVCLIILLAFAVAMPAFALDFDADRLGSVSVTLLDPAEKTPVQGAELAIYRVADVTLGEDNMLRYTYCNGFEACGTGLDDPNLPAVLDRCVEEHSAQAQKAVTDGQGTAVFQDLPLGLYFVKQTNVVAGYSACRAFLVTVPNVNESGYVYDVNASPKTEIAKLTTVSIKKVWNADKTVKIVDHVTVQLLRDGVVVETATLNKENNWKVVYTDMPVSDGYSIKEINVPKGFTATYSQKGYEFTVTNSAVLIQTGQLIWPVPVLALSGLLLIGLGVVLLRRAREAHG